MSRSHLSNFYTMRQSKLFTKTSRHISADEVATNAKLLTQAGFVKREMAGVYSYLPLGWRVLMKIETIVRQEMNAIGGQEIFMPSLHPKANWLATGRWSALDVLFKVNSQHGYEYALGPTHEEIVTPLAQTVISSYKDLPLAVYQIQTKFRDEPRAKSGLLRGREFRMKDLYSFHASDEDLANYYDKTAIPAYQKTFKRLGLNALLTEASGGTFSKFSHEFQVEIASGEDSIFVCEQCSRAKNKEIFEANVSCTNCGKTAWRETMASEVGNIFPLKTKYSDAFNLNFTDERGKIKKVTMGCYGMGTSRLMGVIVEKFNDAAGIIWPESVAPFQLHFIVLGDDDAVRAKADACYKELSDQGIEVLYDDRADSPGVKLKDADLIGLPWRAVMSAKTGEQIELKTRSAKNAKLVSLIELLNTIGVR